MRVVFLLLLFASLALSAQKNISGFTADEARKQADLEARFDALLKAENLDAWLKKLASRPHALSQPYGKESAEFMRDLLKSWGYDAQIETYKVLFPTPKTRVLELLTPTKFVAKLTEPALKEDATSGQTSEQLPVYNAWSADGDVAGELVFVNYGVPDDYEQLEKLGIDVKGKIVIAKYGGSWRGIKPKVAQEHGAVGCIIYSDPEEDGYYQGDVYPKGAYKNKTGAQRGSVMDMPIYPGDPLTPGIGATENATRLKQSEAPNLLKIPVIPISYGDAQPLLEALGGPVAPASWRGALPITYHIGPSTAKVHLKLSFDWKMVDCHNVIAKMVGSEFPNQWVIRGNHHDAWVNGANDPLSGMVAELEEARAIAELMKTGWKPKRTIVFCAWDGEEPGLIGSTEWAEHHAAELQQKTVAYINSDGNGRGFVGISGSHTLETMMNEVVRDVIDPQYGITVLERRKSANASGAANAKAKKDILTKKTISIGALGSGSDYSPFIQHLGIPSLNIGFGGENGGGEYHSIYDSYDHYVRFKDPGFAYGIALAKTVGRTTLRLANAQSMPFNFKDFHRTVNGYLTEVIALLDNTRESTEVENMMLNEKRYVYASDPTKKYIAPTTKEPVPYLNFSPVQNALSELEKSATKLTDKLVSNPTENISQVNELVYRAEQSLLYAKGLPRRTWYQHTIYAPGFYTGYGVKTLPGVREAIEQREWKEAQEQIEILAGTLTAYKVKLDEAIKLLEK
jgi:N-acetylated-alpha-linked acidic dipeptidase